MGLVSSALAPAPETASPDADETADRSQARARLLVGITHGGQEARLDPSCTAEQAALVWDVLAIKEALDAGTDLGSLPLRSRQSDRRLDLLQGDAGGRCAAAASTAAFGEVVAQLRSCMSKHRSKEEDGADAAVRLLSAAVWRRCHALAALLVAAVPTAAAAVTNWESMLQRAVEAALHSGDNSCVELLLRALPDPAAAVNTFGDSLLHQALLDNRSGVAQLLLAAAPAAAAALRRDALGRHALHLASSAGNAEAAQRLLAVHPAAATFRDASQAVPAHLAADAGHADVLRLLLAAAPATATAKDHHGCTPLHAAADSGCVEAAALLLDCGADEAAERALARDFVGRTPAYYAAVQAQAGVLQLLLAAAPEAAGIGNDSGELPIHGAAFAGSVPCLQALLAAARETASSTTRDGMTPLYLAARSGHLQAARLLLAAAPAAATAAAHNGRSPLHTAAWEGHADVAAFLAAAAPAALWQGDAVGWLPIHHAAAQGRIAALRALLEAAPGSALALSERGFNPVHVAAVRGQAEAVSLLLEAAPEAASQVSPSGWTPLGQGVGFITDASQLPAVVCTLLPFGSGTAVLQSLLHGITLGRPMLPLFADFVTCRLPLSEDEWSLIPSPCPGLARALPSALAHSPQQAGQLVRHLPPADAERLRLFALCLHRAQQTLGIDLPRPLVSRLLSLFDA